MTEKPETEAEHERERVEAIDPILDRALYETIKRGTGTLDEILELRNIMHVDSQQLGRALKRLVNGAVVAKVNNKFVIIGDFVVKM